MAPLNFFMTRLLFVEQNKADSLKAKSNQAEVAIVVDNPKILPEQNAKSLPTLPSPLAAPESPVAVEGWKGIRVGGWIHKEDDATTTGAVAKAFSKLAVTEDGGDDDHTEYTQESTSTVDTTTVERPTQLFPSNASRGASTAVAKKPPGSNGGGGAHRKRLSPLKKKATKKSDNTSSILNTGNGSSPSSSGSED